MKKGTSITHSGGIKKGEIAVFIAGYLEINSHMPTLKEIGKGVGLNAVSSIYQHLIGMGFIQSRGDWRKQKLEVNKTMRCPTCRRPYFLSLEEWEKKVEKKSLLF